MAGGGDGDWLSLAMFANVSFRPLPFISALDFLFLGAQPLAPPPSAQHHSIVCPGLWQFAHFGLSVPFDFELGRAGDRDFRPCCTIRAFSC